LALAGGLALACFVKVFGVAFLGRPRRPQPARERERCDAATVAQLGLAALCVLTGVLPGIVLGPLVRIAGPLAGGAALAIPQLPALPATLAALPLLGALGGLALAARRGIRRVPTWTCGSPAGVRTQYTGTAFTKPLRTIFALLLVPERRRIVESGVSAWFPSRIVYRSASRYLIDEVARRSAALLLHAARRARAVQSGSLRLYLTYAFVAVIVLVVAAR
jgi:hypothetical protein